LLVPSACLRRSLNIHDLDVLARGIEDEGDNTTRFLVMSPEHNMTRRGDAGMMTSFVFDVRNIPAALCKAMGGFATNGINMTRLESYVVGGSFSATVLYPGLECHPADANVALATEVSDYFTSQVNMLGVNPRDPRWGPTNQPILLK
jgi:prephenate dehydratase